MTVTAVTRTHVDLPTFAHLSEPLMGFGRCQAALGHRNEALALYRRARTVAAKLSPDHPLVAQAEYRIVDLLDVDRDRREAMPLIEHAVAAWDATGMDVPDAHLARFLLARYRWAAGDRVRARQLAERAQAALAKLDARYATTVEEIEQWRATHR